MKRLITLFAMTFGLAIAAVSGASYAATNGGSEVQVALVPVNGIPLEVSTSCAKGAAVFRVVNAGQKLPSAVTFRIFKLTDGTVVSKRKMKLAVGQAATFKIKGADKYRGTYGLFMDANWVEREQQVDAAVRCSS